ncbi:MAG: YqhA family protein [Bacteroidota bacterium]
MGSVFSFLLRVSGFFAALALFLIGLVVLGYGSYAGIASVSDIFVGDTSGADIISNVLKSVDVVFLGIIIQVLGIGLYELFVRPIDDLPPWLVFKNFDELKLLLIKAAITVVAVSFTGRVVTWQGDPNVAYYGVAIAAVIIGLTFFIRVKKAVADK